MSTETINYKGMDIEIMQDDWPQNPFEEGDCNPALMSKYDRSITSYDSEVGEYPPTLTRAEIVANLSDIKSLLSDSLINIGRDYGRNYAIEEAINESLSEEYKGNFDVLAELWNMKQGYYAESTSSTGYAQGEYVELLILITPKWLKETGADEKEHANIISGTVELYSAWAWGGVYGYNIESNSGDYIGSCWGFYGYDHKESGLLEHAQNDIDCYLSRKKQSYINKLKVLIKNRAPLGVRQKAYNQYIEVL